MCDARLGLGAINTLFLGSIGGDYLLTSVFVLPVDDSEARKVSSASWSTGLTMWASKPALRD
jgi:hypothetical protein